MKNRSLFKNLDENEFNKLIKLFEKKTISKNSVLIKEGENGDTAFLLLNGKVSVVKENMYGEDYIVTIINAGGDELFGEVNLIDKGKRISTITAMESCEIIEITSDKLKYFMDNNPTSGYKIMSYLAQNCVKYLRKADNDVITLFNALVEVVEND